MKSTKSGDEATINDTTAQKIATGAVECIDTTTDNGTTIRTMVSDMGDGTSNDAPTLVHSNQLHVSSTHATVRDD